MQGFQHYFFDYLNCVQTAVIGSSGEMSSMCVCVLCFCVYTNLFYDEVGAKLALQTYHVVWFKLGGFVFFLSERYTGLALIGW